MALYDEILRLVRDKVGLGMNRSSDFDVLSIVIREKTNESLSVNTLKRLFGFNAERVVPRMSTMDIIARYLDYVDYDSLAKSLGNQADISLFSPIETIEIQELNKGTQLKLSYDPDRVFLLTYIGDYNFIVNTAEGSQNIRKGDLLTISQLAVGHRLVVSHVIRDGLDLGTYESAKFRGLKSLEII